MQAYRVASGIIVNKQELLLVQNRRRNGSLDWSTPGGVVDPGEEVLEALQREVVEETSLVVDGWSAMRYVVDVDFVGRDMTLHAQVFEAVGHHGDLHVDDPDHVVVDGRWVDSGQADELLGTAPQWVAEPMRHWMTNVFAAQDETADAPCAQWRYRVTGSGGEFVVELIAFEG